MSYGLGNVDRFLTNMLPGSFNIIVPATFVAGILTYVWPFVTSKGGYIAVGLIYG